MLARAGGPGGVALWVAAWAGRGCGFHVGGRGLVRE